MASASGGVAVLYEVRQLKNVMVNGAERKMYDSLGPLLVVLRYKSKAKPDMVKWSQGGVLLVVSAWIDATSRTGQER